SGVLGRARGSLLVVLVGSTVAAADVWVAGAWSAWAPASGLERWRRGSSIQPNQALTPSRAPTPMPRLRQIRKTISGSLRIRRPMVRVSGPPRSLAGELPSSSLAG